MESPELSALEGELDRDLNTPIPTALPIFTAPMGVSGISLIHSFHVRLTIATEGE